MAHFILQLTGEYLMPSLVGNIKFRCETLCTDSSSQPITERVARFMSCSSSMKLNWTTSFFSNTSAMNYDLNMYFFLLRFIVAFNERETWMRSWERRGRPQGHQGHMPGLDLQPLENYSFCTWATCSTKWSKWLIFLCLFMNGVERKYKGIKPKSFMKLQLVTCSKRPFTTETVGLAGWIYSFILLVEQINQTFVIM